MYSMLKHVWLRPPCRTSVPQEATFSLGERAAVLEQLDKPAIIPHMAEFEGKKFPYEVRTGGARGVHMGHPCKPSVLRPVWEVGGERAGLVPCGCHSFKAWPVGSGRLWLQRLALDK